MTKKQALIIEDNKEIGEIYKMTLNMVDFEAEHIIDGKEGLQRLEDSLPDLIILDMNLPQISGHYIYKKIRSDDRMTNIPVIISTANNIVASALSKELGPKDRLLVKPVSPKQLREILEAIEYD